MEDEEGVSDPDALCAVWEREAKGETATKLRFDELDRQRILQCAVDHPEMVSGAIEAVEQRSAALAGQDFGVVGPELPGLEAKQDVDLDDPPPEVEQALEADDFVIYGKASIQQYDEENTRISVTALEEALDRFFDSEDAPGIISRGHTDVPVGMPMREYQLAEATTIEVGGETYDFDAGDTLRTEAKDADDDQLPELWLVSRLANDSDIARETRYQALTGELNGYSVTVKPKAGARQPTEAGEDILAVDLHAVTLGSDLQIKNKGSEFDVAEFKALARAQEAAEAAAVFIENIPTSMGDTTKWLLQKASGGSDEEPDDADVELNTEQRAEDEDEDEDDEAEEKAHPVDSAIESGLISAGDAQVFREVHQKNEDAVATLLDAVDEGDMDADRAKQLAQDLYGGDAEQAMDEDEVPEDEDFEEDEDDDDEDNEPQELKAAAEGDEPDDAEQKAEDEESDGEADRLDAIESKLDDLVDSVVTEDDLEQRLGEIEDATEAALTAEELEQKLADEDDDLYEVLIQRAEREADGATTPSPTAGDTGGQTLADSVPTGGK